MREKNYLRLMFHSHQVSPHFRNIIVNMKSIHGVHYELKNWENTFNIFVCIDGMSCYKYLIKILDGITYVFLFEPF